MKNIVILFLTFISFNAFAGLDPNITIEGVVGSSFDKEKIKVYDTLGQTYYLPRSVFPKDFKPKEGQPFTVEVTEKMYDSLDIKPGDKKIKIKISLEK